jgi:hypothetical protein
MASQTMGIVVIGIIILFLILFWKCNKLEKLAGNSTNIYTSGADQRILGQVFTSTDEGSSAGHNMPKGFTY